jgi:NAD(P)-dependent dehydrogenase (short-subunit alcohol dehydrogenase family)
VTREPGPIAVVTGGSRGIGFAVARRLGEIGHRLVLLSRSAATGCDARRSLADDGLTAWHLACDVAEEDAVREAFGFVAELGPPAVLVNCAGVYLDDPRRGCPQGIAALELALLRRTLDVNLVGAVTTMRLAIPRMRAAGYGRVVNVSSGMGRFAEIDGEAIAYRTSKAALNAVTRAVAMEVADHDIRVNAVCPGWVRTDMGTPAGKRSPEEGAAGIVQAATLPRGGPTGLLLRDGRDFGW